MIECDGQYLFYSVWRIPCICLVYSILDFGEYVDNWGGWVPLLLHHFFIDAELLGIDVAIGITQILQHDACSDPRETSNVVLNWF
jgi:hypothetical protein